MRGGERNSRARCPAGAHGFGRCRPVRSISGSHDVDHGSGAGRVRGVLCFSCNATLGQFKESAGRTSGGRPSIRKETCGSQHSKHRASAGCLPDAWILVLHGLPRAARARAVAR
ncbi:MULTISPECIES: endonuclease domain-containing protein [Streptomyces]|uniref:endonuclease domain-containing protein n=1 Tax=Streptomyces TaxID=1883 RepID=UPI003B8A87B4